MNKKVLSAIIIIIIIVIALIGAYVLWGKKADTKTIDIEAANQTLANSTPFSQMAMMEITENELQSTYGISEENVEKVYGKMPMMNVQASSYLLIKAKEGKVDTVKVELENYASQYEEQWSRYLPAQYELVQNRKVGVKGNVIYMIIAENAAELAQEITK